MAVEVVAMVVEVCTHTHTHTHIHTHTHELDFALFKYHLEMSIICTIFVPSVQVISIWTPS